MEKFAQVVLVPVFTGLFMVLGVSLLLGAAGIIVYQVIIFLRDGVWPALSAIDALIYYEAPWALAPTSWFGLYKVLQATPLSAGLLVLGVAMILLLIAIATAIGEALGTHRT